MNEDDAKVVRDSEPDVPNVGGAHDPDMRPCGRPASAGHADGALAGVRAYELQIVSAELR